MNMLSFWNVNNGLNNCNTSLYWQTKTPFTVRGRAGPSRGRARPFAHCKRTKGQMRGQKRPRIWSTSGGSLGRGPARPFLTVNARGAKCAAKF